MREDVKTMLVERVNDLVGEGKALLATKYYERLTPFRTSGGIPLVELQAYSKWMAGIQSLKHQLGTLGWIWPLRTLMTRSGDDNLEDNVRRCLGILEEVKEALEKGHLVRVEGLVRAETFSDLLDQADYLLSEGYRIAAGVLGRAVLEEHLRNLSRQHKCVPSKERPTLNDFNQELYKEKHLAKNEMQHVTAMAGVGNDATHGKPVNAADVERLLRDVRAFTVRYPFAT